MLSYVLNQYVKRDRHGLFGKTQTLRYFMSSYMGESNISECTCCYNVRLDSIPVSYNELCKFDYDTKRGVTMKFSKSAESEGSEKQK